MNFIYARFSPRPKEAIERCESLEVQIEGCKRYCEMKQYEVDGVLTDPEVSARQTPLFHRPSGQKLLALPRGSRVIALKLDRMFRETVDGLTTLRVWKNQGVELHLADQGGCSINTATATGELIATFLLGVAAYEPKVIAERTSAGMRHRVSQGTLKFAKEKTPYGYCWSEEHGLVIQKSEEQEVVSIIRSLRETGMTYSQIATKLNSDCIPCRDSTWKPIKVQRILNRLEKQGDHLGRTN